MSAEKYCFTLAELETQGSVAHRIAIEMLRGEWKGSTSRRGLATELKMSPSKVYELEQAAGVALRLARKNGWADEVEGEMAHLNAVRDAAWDAKAYVGKDADEVDQPNLKIICEATKLRMQVMGVIGQKPVAANAPGKPADEYGAMAKAERIALLEQALADERAGEKGAVH